MSEPRTIPLSAIVGRSRFNVRPEGDPAGRDAMAASIRAMGQLQALIVRDEGTPGLYEVDDGGCRWDAMCDLVAADEATPPDHAEPWTWNTDVNVLVVNGDAGRARERSLAANVIRRNLHPVEECEAFADMVRDGVTVDTIAADFGVTVRYVRQRLKLDELSPRVRSLWRAGKILGGLAEVLTSVEGHEAQDHILDRFGDRIGLAYVRDEVRTLLRRTVMEHHAPEARYVGLDSYVASGGRLDEQLFEAHPTILDPLLMKRLARSSMIDEGSVIAERYGFGSVIVRDELDPDERHRWGHLRITYTDAEQAALDSLDDRERGEIEALGDDVDEAADRAIQARYEAMRDAIEQTALERSTTAEQRSAAAVFVSLSYEGELVVDSGRTRPTTAPAVPDAQPARPFAATASPKAEVPSKSADPVKAPGKALVAVMDEAMSKAYAAIVAERPYLAMVLATAALTAMGNRSAIRIRAQSWPRDEHAGADFVEAAAAAIKDLRGSEDVMLRFARAVAGTIDVAPSSTLNGYRHGLVDAAGLAELLAVYGEGAYAPAMVRALDYRAYFEAASKAATLQAIREAGGSESDCVDARHMDKKRLVAWAAEFCANMSWLPAELRKPDTFAMRRSIDTKLPLEMPSLADAMADAMQADGEDMDDTDAVDDAGGPPLLEFDPQTPEDAIKLFLDRHCLRDDERCRIKAQVVFDAFRERMPPAVVDLLSTMPKFGAAIAKEGITKRRTSDGFHYCGLDLRPVEQVRQAAE